MTPQDKVKIIQRTAAAMRWADIQAVQHEITMSEHDGWDRGWKDACRISERFEPLLFLVGWALGVLFGVALLT